MNFCICQGCTWSYAYQIPIYIPENIVMEKIVAIVDKILRTSHTETLEDEINKIFYNLYELTDSEIDLIEQ